MAAVAERAWPGRRAKGTGRGGGAGCARHAPVTLSKFGSVASAPAASGAGAVGQGGCGRCAFPADSGAATGVGQLVEVGRRARDGGATDCEAPAKASAVAAVVRAGRAGDGRRGRVQVVVTTGAAGRRAARGARIVSLPRASGARHLRLEEHEQAAIAVKNGLQLGVAQG